MRPGDVPLLTADLPGTGGVLRTTPDDFVVDELPAYPAAGTGDHVFVRIEKRDLTTPAAIAILAGALAVDRRDIGAAGMKDRRAVTRQWLSLPPPVTPEAALAVAAPGLVVIEAIRHPHKLRTGHLRGNAFMLRVRGVDAATAATRAREILDRLAAPPGAPNGYGAQRFGTAGDNADAGLALIRGDARPGRDRRRDRLLVSALQSALFNHWLAARMADGLYATALAGDVMHKRPRADADPDAGRGGMFDCTDPAADLPRIATGEIVPTGPMFGHRMRAPAAATPAAAREAAVLAAAGVTVDDLRRAGPLAEGTRRDAAIVVSATQVGIAGADAIDVCFTLPSGGYATTIMGEVMKTAPNDDHDPTGDGWT